jgi:hypothetical protein
MDQYIVRWVGPVGIGIHTQEGKSLTFSVVKNQYIPAEFKPGDEVTINTIPGNPPINQGYYEITHIPTGKILRIMGLNEQFKIDP